jgi:hypothetical protein
MATLIGPPMQPPEPPLLTGDDKKDIQRIMGYLQDLVGYLFEYRPTVEAP